MEYGVEIKPNGGDSFTVEMFYVGNLEPECKAWVHCNRKELEELQRVIGNVLNSNVFKVEFK